MRIILTTEGLGHTSWARRTGRTASTQKTARSADSATTKVKVAAALKSVKMLDGGKTTANLTYFEQEPLLDASMYIAHTSTVYSPRSLTTHLMLRTHAVAQRSEGDRSRAAGDGQTSVHQQAGSAPNFSRGPSHRQD